jgi:hypothetical protein
LLASSGVTHQVVQIAGALAILVAYVLGQRSVLDPHSLTYLLLNLVGAGVLTVDAYLEEQWGFFLLESVWTVVTAWSLAGRFRGRPATTA